MAPQLVRDAPVQRLHELLGQQRADAIEAPDSLALLQPERQLTEPALTAKLRRRMERCDLSGAAQATEQTLGRLQPSLSR